MKAIKVNYVLNGKEATEIFQGRGYENKSVAFLAELKKSYMADPYFMYLPQIKKMDTGWSKSKKQKQLEADRDQYLNAHPEFKKPELKISIETI